MKEKQTPGSNAHNLPRCPFSTQCVEWLDEIDHITAERQATDRDSAALRHADKLARHARQCATCTHALAEARKLRKYQRAALRTLLIESEHMVPATTERILAAIKSEAGTPQAEPRTPVAILEPLPFAPSSTARERPTRRRSRGELRHLFAWIAAAAIVLASIATFGQFLFLRGAAPASVSTTLSQDATRASSTLAAAPTVLLKTKDWASVVLARREGQKQSLEQIDPANGHTVQLIPNCCPFNTDVDGIAHNGQNLLYHDKAKQQTNYHLLSGETFTVKGTTGNAIWSTGDEQIFINGIDRIVQITLNTREEKTIQLQSMSIPIPPIYRLEFFYGGAVYASSEHYGAKNLYRIDVNTGNVEQVVTDAALAYPFWLDLRTDANGVVNGSVFYVKYTPDGLPAIYYKAPDEQEEVWRENAVPIGYGSGLLPLYLREEQGVFEVMQMGNTVAEDQLLQQITPSASALCSSPLRGAGQTICADSIAMHPEDGSRLVVGASYPEGTYRLWSINLQQTEKPRQLLQLASRSDTQVQLIGWDKLQTPAA